MNRQELIDQVKYEYAQLADVAGREHHHDSRWETTTPETYYERLLSQVITGIETGRFDRFRSGTEIVEAVANQKNRWGIQM